MLTVWYLDHKNRFLTYILLVLKKYQGSTMLHVKQKSQKGHYNTFGTYL